MSRKVKVKRISPAGVPSPDTGKYVLYIFLVMLILLAGFGLGRYTSSKGSSSSDLAIAERTPIGEAYSAYGPSDVKGIVPVGFKRELQGAVTAATAYVGMTPRLFFAEDNVFEVSAIQLTTPTFTQEFIDGIATPRSEARRYYRTDRDAFMREFPVGYTIQSAEQDKVTVAVWSVLMVAAKPEIQGATESKVHLIDLEWYNNDWKVAGWVTGPGPTPNWQAPSSSILSVDEFLEVIKPFDGGYDYVPSF